MCIILLLEVDDDFRMNQTKAYLFLVSLWEAPGSCTQVQIKGPFDTAASLLHHSYGLVKPLEGSRQVLSARLRREPCWNLLEMNTPVRFEDAINNLYLVLLSYINQSRNRLCGR